MEERRLFEDAVVFFPEDAVVFFFVVAVVLALERFFFAAVASIGAATAMTITMMTIQTRARQGARVCVILDFSVIMS